MPPVNMLKLPLFTMGTLENIQKQLSNDGYFDDMSTIMYAYIKDTEQLAFIHPSDKKIHLIVGNNKKLVQRLNSLPSVQDGDSEVLYICNNIVYMFDGEEYIPTYRELESRLDDIEAELSQKADKATTIEGYGIEDAYTSEQVNTIVDSAKEDAMRYTDNALRIIRY